jgi:hypothetical protein
MANFGFWNVNSLRNLDTDRREIPRFGASEGIRLSAQLSLLPIVFIDPAERAHWYFTSAGGMKKTKRGGKSRPAKKLATSHC